MSRVKLILKSSLTKIAIFIVPIFLTRVLSEGNARGVLLRIQLNVIGRNDPELAKTIPFNVNDLAIPADLFLTLMIVIALSMSILVWSRTRAEKIVHVVAWLLAFLIISFS